MEEEDGLKPNEDWSKEAVEIFDNLNKLTLNSKWEKYCFNFPSEQDFRRDFFIGNVKNKSFSCAIFCNHDEKIGKGVVTFQERAESYRKFVHGGAIATILDSFTWILAYVATRREDTVTKSLELEHKSAIPLFTPVLFEGKVDRMDGNKVCISGLLKSTSGDKIYNKVLAVFVHPKSKL